MMSRRPQRAAWPIAALAAMLVTTSLLGAAHRQAPSSPPPAPEAPANQDDRALGEEIARIFYASQYQEVVREEGHKSPGDFQALMIAWWAYDNGHAPAETRRRPARESAARGAMATRSGSAPMAARSPTARRRISGVRPSRREPAAIVGFLAKVLEIVQGFSGQILGHVQSYWHQQEPLSPAEEADAAWVGYIFRTRRPCTECGSPTAVYIPGYRSGQWWTTRWACTGCGAQNGQGAWYAGDAPYIRPRGQG